MRLHHWMAAAALLGAFTLRAEVPELLELVPEAKGYELIAKLNPLQWHAKGYQVDRADQISGDLKRVGYLLKLTGKDGKKTWVFTAMDPFSKEVGSTLVPSVDSTIYQTYVDNLEVATNVEGVATGKFEKGNIEFWGKNYGGGNAKQIPGATDAFDFGDAVGKDGNYGSMQVHNFLEKQTVFAVNKLADDNTRDIGIGNNPNGNKDWTFASSGKNYSDAELYIVGQFDNFKLTDVVTLNSSKVELIGKTDRNPVEYAVGDTITFTLTADIGEQKPTVDYFINWSRTGDDGKTEKGKAKLADGAVTIKTSLDRPGFVRIYATLTDRNGRNMKRNVMQWGQERSINIFFDGGAAAAVSEIKQAAPEPEDFDAFWVKQKARLAEVPLKAKMDKLDSKNGNDVYAVSVDCAGPRPVTGYLTIPEGAADKSLPARVIFQGYGVGKQGIQGGSKNEIQFQINAHGFELGKDDAFYKAFGESIKSNGQGYAFDPKQNANAEEAYFNHMALRLMRSLEFVKQLPQWNGKSLIAQGGSQGGLQSIWAASLDQDVTNCQSDVTWCCNMAGNEVDKRLFGGWYIKYVPALGYYDAVNHAKRIKCPVTITRAGLGDYVCPPSGLAVLYNNITAPKKIFWVQGSDHGYVPTKPERFMLEAK